MTEPKWLTLARAEMGVKEGAGAINNKRVVQYYADAGFSGIKSDSVAWCAAFAGAMLHRAGIKPSGSLAAMSYKTFGKKLISPVVGCIAVKTRVGGGHVGFVAKVEGDYVYLLGGNQMDSVNIVKHHKSDFIAFRWPAGTPKS